MRYFFQPITPFFVNQGFGENRACVPIKGGKVISCNGNKPPPGYKPLYGPKGHLGIDLAARHGQPVYCACGGVVDSVDTEPKSGLDVKVVSVVGGKKYKHIYEHLLGYQVKKGDKINLGDLVGWADNTGYSSGDHLHFQLEELVKDKWLPVDPLPLLEPISALEFAGLWRRVKELTARVADFISDKLRRQS